MSVLFWAEFPKRHDVMNIKLLSELNFSQTAMLASVFITITSIAALLAPVRAIIIKLTAFPDRTVFTAPLYTLPLPLYHARFGAKAATTCMRLFDLKSLAAFRTLLANTFLEMWLFTAKFRARDARPSFRKINAKALLRAKANAVPAFAYGNFILAYLTKSSGEFCDSKILFCIDRGRTFPRAVFSRPTAVIPENLMALRAGCINAARSLVARFRAIQFVTCRRIERVITPALWTRFGYSPLDSCMRLHYR